MFTDPIVVTGALTSDEIAIRASVGFFLFAPPGLDETLLREAGFEPTDVVDRTENIAKSAQRWHDVRAARADDLEAHRDRRPRCSPLSLDKSFVFQRVLDAFFGGTPEPKTRVARTGEQ